MLSANYIAANTGSIRYLDITSHDNADYEQELTAFFKLRRQLFIDILGWDVSSYNGLEIDQYDRKDTRYFLFFENDNLIAGTRCIQCSNSNGYMLLDAELGRIKNIDKSIIKNASKDSKDVELTRFTVNPFLGSARRNNALKNLSNFAFQALNKDEYRQGYAIMHPGFIAWFKKNIGIDAKRLGPVIGKGSDAFCAIGAPIANKIDQKVA